MKILDKYILTTFLKTFLSVFSILIFIFILQSVWLFVRELAGKDLDLMIVAKFLFYLLPTLVPLILPLTILLTSIMIFGNFAENYEFAAMKSSGISLQRAMRGLTIFVFILSVITFFFANNVIPWGEYQSRNLRRNIAQLTPTMAIAEGQFNAIGDKINIKVGRKYGPDDKLLEDIILHQKTQGKNTTVIRAERGEIISSKESNILQLILFNGNYYNDIIPKDFKKRRRYPHAKSAFEKYTINIDLSALADVDLNQRQVNNSHRMLKINQLIPTIDSLSNQYYADLEAMNQNTFNSLALYTYKERPMPEGAKKVPSAKDSLPLYLGDIMDLYTSVEKRNIYESAFVNTTSYLGKIDRDNDQYRNKLSRINLYKIAIHKKFALAFSCFILFFVGAPLGAIIRKGGMGLPMVLAIFLFLAYWFIGIFAENSADAGSIPTFLGAWMSTLILLPMSISLTRKATRDRGLSGGGGIFYRFGRFIMQKTALGRFIKAQSQTKKKAVNVDKYINATEYLFHQYILIKNASFEDFEAILIEMTNEFHIPVCGVFKNNDEEEFLLGLYESIDSHDFQEFSSALKMKLLVTKSSIDYVTYREKNQALATTNYTSYIDIVSEEVKEQNDKTSNKKKQKNTAITADDKLQAILKPYKTYALVAFIASLIFFGNLGYVQFSNPSATSIRIIEIIHDLSLITYLSCLIQAYINHRKFNQLYGKGSAKPIGFFYLLALPLYPILYFYLKKQIYNESKNIR